MICGNILQSPLNFPVFLKNRLTFIKHSTGILLMRKQAQIKNAAHRSSKGYGLVSVFSPCLPHKHLPPKAQPGSSVLKDSCGTELLLWDLRSLPNINTSGKLASAKLPFFPPLLSSVVMPPSAFLPAAVHTDATPKSIPSAWQNQKFATCYAQREYHFQMNSCCNHWA